MVEKARDRAGAAGWLAPAVSAAAVGIVLLAAVGLSGLDLGGSPGPEPPFGPDRVHEVTRATNGEVDDEFTCPAVLPHNFGSGQSPLLGAALGGPRAFADEMGATRFELEGTPEATVLRLGNADGSLASLNTLHQRPDGSWVLDDMTACTGEGGPLVPTRQALRLGEHGVEPWPIEVVAGGWSGSVLVDDRRFYNAAGVIQHRSLFVKSCEEAVCLASGDGVVMETGQVPAGPAPTDLSDVFTPDEPLLARDPPFAFYGVYDLDDRVAGVAWVDTDGGIHPTTSTQPPGWPGALHLVLAPADRIAAVAVDHVDGDRLRYAVP